MTSRGVYSVRAEIERDTFDLRFNRRLSFARIASQRDEASASFTRWTVELPFAEIFAALRTD